MSWADKPFVWLARQGAAATTVEAQAMRLSCNAHCLRGRPLRDSLAAIREVGYEAVEVNWPRVERRFASAESCADAFEAVLNEAGLAVSALRVADMNAVDETEIEQVVSAIRPQIALAGSLQLEVVMMRGGDRRQQPLEILAAGLRPLLAQSGACGIRAAGGQCP